MLNGHQTRHWFTWLILLAIWSAPLHAKQIFFKESTFTQFAYPNGQLDKEYTNWLKQRAREQFPNARASIIESYITMDKPRDVLTHYSALSGQRFLKKEDRFIYVYSQLGERPATRIEIYPVPIARINQAFWPTRVDLHIIRLPLNPNIPVTLEQDPDNLKGRTGRYFYPNGELREDVAIIEMEELGPSAQVYVLATSDDFEKVYRFFRRRYGGIPLRMPSDGDMLTRDFEIDLTRALGEEDAEKVLYVRVEENPVVVDRSGNSQLYRDWVFITYTFWEVEEEEL